MKTFKDTEGTEWQIALTLGVAKKIKDQAGVDLLDLDGGNLFQKLIDDPFTLGDVLYIACQGQAEKRSISAEQFADRLAGDAIAHGTSALLEALVDFFPSSKRPLLTRVLAMAKRVEAEMIRVGTATLDDPKLEAHVLSQLSSRGNSSTAAPQSAIETPTT
jgi:hypothetical protein